MQSDKFQYGNDFLVKLTAAILTDQRFLIKCLDLEIQKYIESQPHEWLIKMILQYYITYKAIPSLDSILIKINSLTEAVLKQSINNTYLTLLEILDNNDIAELQFVKDTAIQFCRFKQVKFAILQSIDILQSTKNIEAVYDIINKTRFKGIDPDIGIQYVSSFYQRHEIKQQKAIETPWPIITSVFKGGFKPARLYVILAPAGVGKSWMFVNIAAEAIKQGKKVAYYTLQMTEFEIGQRIDSKLLGRPLQYVRHSDNKDECYAKLLPYKDFLRIKQFFPNQSKLLDIENHYNQLKLYQDFDADMVIIDYGDILKKQGSINSMYTAYGDIFTNMKTFAKMYKIPVITASQGDRSSMESEVVLGNQTSHSIGKIQIADGVISMSRTNMDKASDTARFAIIKNRGGKDGMIYNGRVDFDIGVIQIFDTFTRNSVQSRKKMDNNDALTRQKMKQRLLALQQK